MAKREKAKPKAAKASAKSGRLRQLSRKQNRLKAKIEARSRVKLPGSFSLVKDVFKIFKQFWRPLGGILLVYLALNIIFASGLSTLSSTTSDIKHSLSSGENSHFVRAIDSFGTLIGTGGASSAAGSSFLQT